MNRTPLAAAQSTSGSDENNIAMIIVAISRTNAAKIGVDIHHLHMIMQRHVMRWQPFGQVIDDTVSIQSAAIRIIDPVSHIIGSQHGKARQKIVRHYTLVGEAERVYRLGRAIGPATFAGGQSEATMPPT